jgi:hypothetical protein
VSVPPEFVLVKRRIAVETPAAAQFLVRLAGAEQHAVGDDHRCAAARFQQPQEERYDE